MRDGECWRLAKSPPVKQQRLPKGRPRALEAELGAKAEQQTDDGLELSAFWGRKGKGRNDQPTLPIQGGHSVCRWVYDP